MESGRFSIIRKRGINVSFQASFSVCGKVWRKSAPSVCGAGYAHTRFRRERLVKRATEEEGHGGRAVDFGVG